MMIVMCSFSLLSVHGGLKLSIASVLGTLHSCTVTSAAVLLLSLSLFPARMISQQVYLSCKHVDCCSNYAHPPTLTVMQAEKD